MKGVVEVGSSPPVRSKIEAHSGPPPIAPVESVQGPKKVVANPHIEFDADSGRLMIQIRDENLKVVKQFPNESELAAYEIAREQERKARLEALTGTSTAPAAEAPAGGDVEQRVDILVPEESEAPPPAKAEADHQSA